MITVFSGFLACKNQLKSNDEVENLHKTGVKYTKHQLFISFCF